MNKVFPKSINGGSSYAVERYSLLTNNGKFSNKILIAHSSALIEHLKVVYLNSNDFVYQRGDQIKYIYFPENAVISEYQMLADGRASEVAMIGKEGITGLEVILNSGTASRWMCVAAAGNAVKIRSEIFKEEFDYNSGFREKVLNYLRYYLDQTSQKVICTNFHLIENRLCSWLLRITSRSGKNSFPITHEQLAHFLGVQRPSITRITQDLRARGIINYERGAISISNYEKLKDTACSCYTLS